jgi:hypothetical protein
MALSKDVVIGRPPWAEDEPVGSGPTTVNIFLAHPPIPDAWWTSWQLLVPKLDVLATEIAGELKGKWWRDKVSSQNAKYSSRVDVFRFTPDSWLRREDRHFRKVPKAEIGEHQSRAQGWVRPPFEAA